MSPCLRIPSPKFLTRERSKSKERGGDSSEKGADSGTEKEKERGERLGLGWGREKARKVTPEAVSAPILREAHAHPGVRAPGPTSSHGHGHGHGHADGAETQKAQKSPGLAPPARSPVTKPSLPFIRRGGLGSFDFEHLRSRTSSNNGQSNTDDEKEKENGRARRPVAPPSALDALQSRHKHQHQHQQPPKHKPTSPPPPLPRPKQRSPPPVRPRARSPLAASPAMTAQTNSTATHDDFDDSALPRLSSSLAREREYRAHHRMQASLPAFSFEPVGGTPSAKSTRDKVMNGHGRGGHGGATYVDPHTGLMWAPTPVKESAIAEEGTGAGGGARRSVSVKRPAMAREGGAKVVNRISPRELEAATAVIAQFKSALDDAGFATLQKCEFMIFLLLIS